MASGMIEITIVQCATCGCSMIADALIYTPQDGLEGISFHCQRCNGYASVRLEKLGTLAKTLANPPPASSNPN